MSFFLPGKDASWWALAALRARARIFFGSLARKTERY
jgi:hypothetical protein